MEDTRLPKFGYFLDETDPDIVVLRRQDGTFVAAFSSRAATKAGIMEAVEEDYLTVVRDMTEAHVEVYDRR